MKRREFLLLPLLAQGQPVPLRFFTQAEAKVVAAACERICPKDESGPGATEAGVVIFIDRQLAGPYGRDAYRYRQAPFVASVKEHGHQGPETSRDLYRAGIALLGLDFAELPATTQDAKLREIEKTLFFQLLRTHTIEGMFCDPLHGGNQGMAGWQMIGFPGPLMGYKEEMVASRGKAWRRKPKSLEQTLGRQVKGMEDQ